MGWFDDAKDAITGGDGFGLDDFGKIVGTSLAGPVGGYVGSWAGDQLQTGLESMPGKYVDEYFDKRAEGRAKAYEHPSAIRARYESAGFNPTLAFNGNGAGTTSPNVGQSSAASSLIAQMMGNNSQEKIAASQLLVENERLALLAQELALKSPSQSPYGAGTVRNGVGGAAAAADQAPDAMTASPELGDAPTFYLSPEIQGSVAPDELIMENLNRGTAWQWLGDLADKNPVPHSFQEWSPADFFIPGGKPGRLSGLAAWESFKPSPNPNYGKIDTPMPGNSWAPN